MRSTAPLHLLLSTLVLAVVPACSYSWEIGKGEGGTGGTGGAAGGSGGASSTTTGTDACPSLENAMKTAQIDAQACSYAGAQVQGECASSVPDACGCKVFVKDASSAATKAFTSAVSAFDAAGCSPSCAGCSALQTGTCLQNASVVHCVP
ncbi:MAG: hypothetical protein U0441_37385 [Polyangiaceae bacterium]